MNKVNKAVIPAAGLGTRFLPVTKGVPKEMLNIVDRPAIQYVVEEAVGSGITDILIIVSEGKDSIRNYFSPHHIYDGITNRSNLTSIDELMQRANFHFAVQKELNGNGAAVLMAKEFADGEPIAVLFGDDIIYNTDSPATKQLISAYEMTGKCVLGCQVRPDQEAIKYGVIKKGDAVGSLTKVLDLVEKPGIDELPSNLCSLGRYVLPPSIFSELENAPLYKGEIYLTTAIKSLIAKEGVYAYNFIGNRYDLGDKFGFMQANIEYALRSQFGGQIKDYLTKLVGKL